MWIKTENTATKRLYNEDLMDDPVSFFENGTTQVTEELGETLCSHYETISPHNQDDDKL